MVYSLDGFVGGTKGELDWENRDEEVSRQLVPEFLSTVDTMLLGRVLYQGFQQAWPAMAKNPASPKELVDFARWIEDTPKVVWKNSRLVSVKSDDDIAKEVTNLKRQSGGDMVVFGGARFAQTLSRLGLVDEYRLKLQPVALGTGQPLFKSRVNLKLVKSQAFKSGVVALYYQPAK
jgi:dihydrofolate reductase